MRSAALITGGGNRIGRAIALDLATQGFSVALHCNHSQQLARETAIKIKKSGVPCEIFPCDFSRENEVEEFFHRVVKKFPQLNLLINSASIFEKSQLLTSNAKSFENHFAVNFKAPLTLSRAFAHACKKGQIMNILDTHITDHKTAHSDYLLSKKLLGELTQLSAVEFAPHIRVNAIAPGLILPPENEKNTYLDRLAKNIPLKRKGSVKNITHAIRFLLENDYVTGQTIFVDGGEHLI